MLRRLKVVGVMGSGHRAHSPLARAAGRAVAQAGCHLLTGGGGGVMAAAAEAFCRMPGRAGCSIGIIRSRELPAPDAAGRRSYRPLEPNPWVEIAIFTHLPLSGREGNEVLSRNHLNVLTADVLVVLPGSWGTLSEVRLRTEYGRRAILFLAGEKVGGWTGRELVGFPWAGGLLREAADPEELAGLLELSLAKEGSPGGWGPHPADPA